MADYRELRMLAYSPRIGSARSFAAQAVPFLVDAWLTDYGHGPRSCDIVETVQEGYSFLFDVTCERLVAAWGVSRAVELSSREGYRQRTHPLPHKHGYDRGHAIAHSLGGRLDINVVPQLRSINRGRFRVLEMEARRKPGSIYFTYWKYSDHEVEPDQTPHGVDQGLLRWREHPLVHSFANHQM